MPSNDLITFLRTFKRALVQGNWLIVQRRVVYARITQLTTLEIKQILLTLTPLDYVAGPEKDRDRPGEVLWIFHKDGANVPNLYIKLKLTPDGTAKVIFFHQSRYSPRR